MAEILVIGHGGPSSWQLTEELRVAGHQVELVTSRRIAQRLCMRGRPDALVVDSPLADAEEQRLFAALERAVPGLPRLLTRVVARGQIWIPRRRGATPEPQALSRVLAYLYGLAAGRRIAVPAEIEPIVPRPPRLLAIATDVRRDSILFEYISAPPGGPTADRALRVLGGKHAIQAVARLRFPGRGTLSVRGVTTTVTRWEGAPPALLLRYQPEQAKTRVHFRPSGAFQKISERVRAAKVGLQRISARIRRISGRLIGAGKRAA